jgi:phosphoenolpyruvate carboxykinase (ATP)
MINPTISQLYQDAAKKGMYTSSTGALLAYSGDITGRSPKDKRIVYDDNTKDIWWGSVNIPISPLLYSIYKTAAAQYLKNSDILYSVDCYAGWNEDYRIKVRLYTTNPYHALFIRNLLIFTGEVFDEIDFTIYDVSELKLGDIKVDDEIKDNNLKDTLVGLNFTTNDMILYGSEYAGELKKAIFTLFMYLLPLKNSLCLHSSANVDLNRENLCMFFGLSGTGKTSLSVSADRLLIGDDEHGFVSDGMGNVNVFNIEGGNYAKCINLDKNKEPDIFGAIKYGAVIENVVVNKDYEVMYDDCSITENTRCAYPLSHINNAVIPATVNLYPKNIIFLTCDSFGLLPPLAKLNHEQAYDFFIAGFTSKLAGTEQGIKEPTAVFSSCFGEPFLIWSPKRYGELLKSRLEEFGSQVWLLNTGWVGGGVGVGKRISILISRLLVTAIHSGEINNCEFSKFPVFGFEIPKKCGDIGEDILNPLVNYPGENYLEKLEELSGKFRDKINSY